MNNIYEYFSCKSKEELYEKIKNEEKQVRPLLDFIEYAKADIKNKNRVINSPDILVEYVKSTTLPTKDTGTIIFVDTKNQPVHLKRTRLSRKNDMKETLKEGLLSGGTRVFIAYNADTPNNRISQIQSLFENIGMKIIDTLGYNKDKDYFTSSSVGRSLYASNSYDLVNDSTNEYINDDFSLKEKYTDFSSHFATNGVIGLSVIDDIQNIKEKLKIGFQHHHQEVLGIIGYNSDEKVILAEELFKGGTDSSLVDLKIIAKKLLQFEDVKGTAVFHNHPSGNPEPSKEDIAMTRKVAQMCDVLGVELLDHFIVGKEKTLSFSEEVGEFQSENFRYQDKISNLRNVSEEGMSYKNASADVERGDVIRTSLSDSTIVLDVRDDYALLFDGRQFIEAYGMQKDQDKFFWNQGHYYDNLPKEIFADYRENTMDTRENLKEIIDNHYKDFVKALITTEKGIEDENILDELYDRFMDNDGVNLLNDYFDDVLYDLEHYNTVSEVGRVGEKISQINKIDIKVNNKEIKHVSKNNVEKIKSKSLLKELRANTNKETSNKEKKRTDIIL